MNFTMKVKTESRLQFVNITEKLKQVVEESKVREGILLLFCPHTTAGVTINESADPDVVRDIITELKTQYPQKSIYKHCEGNSDAHIKSSLIGPSLILIIQNGSIALGRWQGIFFCDFDGPRSRELWGKILADSWALCKAY